MGLGLPLSGNLSEASPKMASAPTVPAHGTPNVVPLDLWQLWSLVLCNPIHEGH